MPTAWYNVVPELPEPLQPPLHPGTKEPVGPDDLAPLFPMALIEQEMTTDPWVDIPGEVLDILRLWRPTPLVRAERLEQRARHAGAHLLQGRVGVARRVAQAEHRGARRPSTTRPTGTARLATETGAGQWGTALVVRVRAVRPRLQGLHGARVVRAEAVPPHHDGDVGARGRRVTGRRPEPSGLARRSRSATRCATRRRVTTRTTRSARCSTTCCCTRRSSASRRRSSSRSRARPGPTS